MSGILPTLREQRYNNKTNADRRAAVPVTRRPRGQTAARSPNGVQAPAGPAAPAPQNDIQIQIPAGGPPSPSGSDSPNSSNRSPRLPWSPATPGPAPAPNLFSGAQQPLPNTDLTVELPWPVRLYTKLNYLRLYGTTMTTEYEGPDAELDYFTGRVYGYVDRQDPDTGRTVLRLQSFFQLSTVLHLYRLSIMSAILYRIPLTLFRYGLMTWGFFPLCGSDFLMRWWLEALFLSCAWLCFEWWPWSLRGHIFKLAAAFFIQTAVWSYFGEQKALRDLIFEHVHPVVWVSGDVLWTVLHQHTRLPLPSASAIWYVAGLDINPIYFMLKMYPVAVRAYNRWTYCKLWPTELQSLCITTDEAEFPVLVQSIAEPLTLTTTFTKEPTVTEVLTRYFPITKPTIVTETETETIFKGPITDGAIVAEHYVTAGTRSMHYFKVFITSMAQTITGKMYGPSSTVPVADSTCPWTYTGSSGTTSPPAPCGS